MLQILHGFLSTLNKETSGWVRRKKNRVVLRLKCRLCDIAVSELLYHRVCRVLSLGVERVPIPTSEGTYTVVLFIYTYCTLCSLLSFQNGNN
jgi:hypothetical protein